MHLLSEKMNKTKWKQPKRKRLLHSKRARRITLNTKEKKNFFLWMREQSGTKRQFYQRKHRFPSTCDELTGEKNDNSSTKARIFFHVFFRISNPSLFFLFHLLFYIPGPLLQWNPIFGGLFLYMLFFLITFETIWSKDPPFYWCELRIFYNTYRAV